MKRLAIIALSLATLSLPSPALADHEGRSGDTNPVTVMGHWYHAGKAYSSPPIIDRNVTMRNGVNLFDNAAWYWRVSAGYIINPFLKSAGGDPRNCNPQDWTIVVCIKDLGPAKASKLAESTVFHFDNIHIQFCVIYINIGHPGGFTDEQLIRTARHEVGHCLGLGHTVAPGSVMNAVPSSGYAVSHDLSALGALYTHGH